MKVISNKSIKQKVTKSGDEWAVCSLFAGCGGLDLGFLGDFRYKDEHYEDNGFDIKAAYEISPQAVETYRNNIGNHIHESDLSILEANEIPSHQVLIGGFPCQDFSSCGPQRGLSSERGQLYKVFLKVMQEHRPKVVVAENVPHLLRMKKGEVIKTIKNDLESVGYRFQVWTLYAPDFGVPQNRMRVFLIGVREDLPGFPTQPNAPFYSTNYRSIDWAISDLEDILDETIPNQSQYFKASRAKRGNGQGDEVSKAGEPSYTIRANAKSRVQFHYKLGRRLTVRECARLQTFPDEFVFNHSATTNIMQIGNAVPPVLGHYVAKSISQYLGAISKEDEIDGKQQSYKIG
ncbi:DNA cytosine methyltransferase [Paenibacillus timonensis]|uniref:DNA (cytosine-5-)-methyltransferase n=1 Tax=Paenibacillus timonensis TaxID=225915 RepID=A0ABW3S765_9BACL|nr:DNA cytosine methyltransferase [Paenibacillus timonensis]MCH1638934.1 DNA cytosine methyltransferase [Paenibacillus timonensis]